jgi:hypothetical protein
MNILLLFAILQCRFHGRESFYEKLGTILFGALHTQSQDLLERNPVHLQILVG